LARLFVWENSLKVGTMKRKPRYLTPRVQHPMPRPIINSPTWVSYDLYFKHFIGSRAYILIDHAPDRGKVLVAPVWFAPFKLANEIAEFWLKIRRSLEKIGLVRRDVQS
jgi:hypothetical protein